MWLTNYIQVDVSRDRCCKHPSIVNSAITKWSGCVWVECVRRIRLQHKQIFTTFNRMFSSQIDLWVWIDDGIKYCNLNGQPTEVSPSGMWTENGWPPFLTVSVVLELWTSMALAQHRGVLIFISSSGFTVRSVSVSIGIDTPFWIKSSHFFTSTVTLPSALMWAVVRPTVHSNRTENKESCSLMYIP